LISFLKKNFFFVILAIFEKFEAKGAKNGSKNQKTFLVRVCILHFLKKDKFVVTYSTGCTTSTVVLGGGEEILSPEICSQTLLLSFSVSNWNYATSNFFCHKTSTQKEHPVALAFTAFCFPAKEPLHSGSEL
jgi:hypothetical protein